MRPAILLDLDRTLVDVESHVDYCAALTALKDAGYESGSDLGPETSWGSCTREVVDLLLSLSDGESRLRAERIVVPHEVEGARAAVAMPGLEELRVALQGRDVAIVTLLSGPATEVVAARFGLWTLTVPRMPGVPAKPAPDQLHMALDRLGASPADAVMVGDSERDAAAARAAGVAFIGVTNGRTEHDFGEAEVVATLHDLVRRLQSDAGTGA